MAFKIHTQATLTPPKPQESKPQKPQISEIPPQTPTKPTYNSKPLGSLDSSLPQTSNSAFSSLFLSQKDWLQKEFGITDEKVKDLLEESAQENYLADFLWELQSRRI